MEKLSRQIGFVKPKNAEFNPSVKEQDIVDWINTHNKFKWSKMCLEIGIDKGNFQRMLKKGKITLSDEKIKQIKLSIGEYGWK